MNYQSIKTIYEDGEMLVIDKPAGLIIHEGAGHSVGPDGRVGEDRLLTDWIGEYHPEIIENFSKEPAELYFRPGIVHRLDKDTSGLLVIAKTPKAKAELQKQFKDRKVDKTYTALVLGRPKPAEGLIETLIARHPRRRKEMAVSYKQNAKAAITEYKTIETFRYKPKGTGQPEYLSLLSIKLHSGRMHQIRVHCKHQGWPIVGDTTYQTKPGRRISQSLNLSHQFLHASKLKLIHPTTGEILSFESPLPSELTRVIDSLERAE